MSSFSFLVPRYDTPGVSFSLDKRWIQRTGVGVSIAFLSRPLRQDQELVLQVMRSSNSSVRSSSFVFGITTCDPNSILWHPSHGQHACGRETGCGGSCLMVRVSGCSRPGHWVSFRRSQNHEFQVTVFRKRFFFKDMDRIFQNSSAIPFIILNGDVSQIQVSDGHLPLMPMTWRLIRLMPFTPDDGPDDGRRIVQVTEENGLVIRRLVGRQSVTPYSSNDSSPRNRSRSHSRSSRRRSRSRLTTRANLVSVVMTDPQPTSDWLPNPFVSVTEMLIQKNGSSGDKNYVFRDKVFKLGDTIVFQVKGWDSNQGPSLADSLTFGLTTHRPIKINFSGLPPHPMTLTESVYQNMGQQNWFVSQDLFPMDPNNNDSQSVVGQEVSLKWTSDGVTMCVGEETDGKIVLKPNLELEFFPFLVMNGLVTAIQMME